MKRPSAKENKLRLDLSGLSISEKLSYYVNLEMRQVAYVLARGIGIKLCIQEDRVKRGRFEITRIA